MSLTWSLVTPATSPTPRYGGRLCWYPPWQCVVLLGGTTDGTHAIRDGAGGKTRLWKMVMVWSGGTLVSCTWTDTGIDFTAGLGGGLAYDNDRDRLLWYPAFDEAVSGGWLYVTDEFDGVTVTTRSAGLYGGGTAPQIPGEPVPPAPGATYQPCESVWGAMAYDKTRHVAVYAEGFPGYVGAQLWEWGVAATGLLTCQNAASNGDTLTIPDGVHTPVVYEYNSGAVAPGHVRVPPGGSAVIDGANLAAAIVATQGEWFVVADQGTGAVELTAKLRGSIGNQAFATTGAWMVPPIGAMTGGVDAWIAVAAPSFERFGAYGATFAYDDILGEIVGYGGVTSDGAYNTLLLHFSGDDVSYSTLVHPPVPNPTDTAWLGGAYNATRETFVLKTMLETQESDGTDFARVSLASEGYVAASGVGAGHEMHGAMAYDEAVGVMVLYIGLAQGAGIPPETDGTYLMRDPGLVSIAVTADSTLLVGGSAKMTAIGTYDDASTRDITALVAWSTSDDGVATIDETGKAHVVSVGGVDCTATLGVSGFLDTVTMLSPFSLSFHLGDKDNPLIPLLAHNFLSAEVMVRWPADGGFAAATVGHIVEIGNGDYELMATPEEAATGGCGYIYAKSADSQSFSEWEFISHPSDPVIKEVPFEVISYTDPLDGVETGLEFTLGEVQLLFSGGAYAAQPLDQIVERGYNMYAVLLTSEQRGDANRRKVYVWLAEDPGVTRQFTAFYNMIADSISDWTPPVINAETPTPSTTPGTSGGFPADFGSAKSVPIVIDVIDTFGLAYVSVMVRFDASGVEELAYRDNVFRDGFTVNSAIVDVENGISISIMPDGLWPDADQVIVGVDAIDVGGARTSATFIYQLPAFVQTVYSPPPVQSGSIDHVAAALSRVRQQFLFDPDA